MNKLAMKLIIRGNDLATQPFKKIEFSNDDESDTLLNDLQGYPHAFVIGCLMDRQLKTHKAWMIPYQIKKISNGFEISDLYQLSLDEVIDIFHKYKLHRFNDRMAKIFYLAVDRIYHIYNSDASK
ncbi:MAG: iron-sulfur cluster loop, partial [Candidatus Aminicenantes bacterium]|nr:iron-sulfur cluster loop [Candidatus Aminicenantes bacterium]